MGVEVKVIARLLNTPEDLGDADIEIEGAMFYCTTTDRIFGPMWRDANVLCPNGHWHHVATSVELAEAFAASRNVDVRAIFSRMTEAEMDQVVRRFTEAAIEHGPVDCGRASCPFAEAFGCEEPEEEEPE